MWRERCRSVDGAASSLLLREEKASLTGRAKRESWVGRVGDDSNLSGVGLSWVVEADGSAERGGLVSRRLENNQGQGALFGFWLVCG